MYYLIVSPICMYICICYISLDSKAPIYPTKDITTFCVSTLAQCGNGTFRCFQKSSCPTKSPSAMGPMAMPRLSQTGEVSIMASSDWWITYKLYGKWKTHQFLGINIVFGIFNLSISIYIYIHIYNYRYIYCGYHKWEVSINEGTQK